MMHFQDDLANAVEERAKKRDDVEGLLGLFDRLEAFSTSVDRAYERFRKVAEEVRAPFTPFTDVYPALKFKVRQSVEQLLREMEALISEADRHKVIGQDLKLRRDLNRFRINVERLYFALETIAYEGNENTADAINLSTTLRKLYLAAAERDRPFVFSHVHADYAERMNWRLSSGTTVIAYRDQIISALQNVLLNALRFAAESERREILYGTEAGPFDKLMMNYTDRVHRYQPRGEWIVFHILNSGARVPEKHKNSLFGYGTTFGDNAHERYGGGSGVGLAIAKLMITDNGGLIFYNPGNSLHTDFCIALPVQPSDRIEEAQLFAQEYPR